MTTVRHDVHRTFEGPLRILLKRVWMVSLRGKGFRLISVLLLFIASACGKEAVKARPTVATNGVPVPIVTFVELGSENCVPCRMMKPVMKAVEEGYGGKVRVVFHDVWTAKGKAEGSKYGLRVIPTQVFLDRNGAEFFRHEGFLSKKEIDQLLTDRIK